VGVDTGGTFTDFVCFDGKHLTVHKVPSTPDDPARAVLAGLTDLLAERAGSSPQRKGRGRPIPTASRITYGTTVATNAVLERKGARVVLLTTAGFEDIIEIGRQARSELYTLEPRKPEPLVSRRRRVGVAERLEFDGQTSLALTVREVERAVAAVRALGAESVAVCFLHSYASSAHERQIGRSLEALGIPCSLSHELVAEYREYERLSTTVINAYVAPVMSRHLRSLERGLPSGVLRVMQSNGGAISARTASRHAVRTLLSGPAAGVIGASAAASRVGVDRIITFDMGGTSTDVALVDGDVQYRNEWEIAGLPLNVPAIDIHTVGAGGGSLAYRDAGGALKVGPQSAGADPGPACYGRGRRATVTDADVVLGRLVPEAFLGGRMRLEVERARGALQELGERLGLDAEQAAEGVVRVVNAGMERAIRRISVERGYDPREYTLVAFGGAAGMHACDLAAGLGIRRVVVPYHPGLLSAWGAIAADAQRDYVQTVRLIDPEAARLRRTLARLERRVRDELRREGYSGSDAIIFASLDVRYRGQSYEIAVPMSDGYRRAFHASHAKLYGYADVNRSLEVVNLRVTAIGRTGVRPRVRPSSQPARPLPHRVRWGGRWLRARRLDRSSLPAQRLHGPIVIADFSATVFVPPGWSVVRSAGGDLRLEG